MTYYFCAGSPGEWLQVDLKTPTTVTGVVTQGRPDSSKWVTSFKVAFGNFTDHLKMIQDFDEEDVVSLSLEENSV